MGANENWILTDFSGERGAKSLTLEIQGLGEFTVAQFSMTYALNEVPRAACMIAIGRDAFSNGASKLARIHEVGSQLQQMLKAKVWFSPTGDWDKSGKKWSGRRCVFMGYYVGLAYRKITDKVQPVLHLIHWTCDLGFSSVLGHNMHPVNPASLIAPCVFPTSAESGAGDPPAYIGGHFGVTDIVNTARSDLWKGIKSLMCEMASIDKFPLGCKGTCSEGPGEKKQNDRALDALKHFEGPATKCNLGYAYAKPLKLNDRGVPMVAEACGHAITDQTLDAVVHTTFWDHLIGTYCPMFTLAVVPLVSRALVVADTPGLQKPWRTIYPEDYDDFDLTGMLTRPLQAVGVYADYESLTSFGETEPPSGDGASICVGGHYAADAKNKSDGVWMIVGSPPWLKMIPFVGRYAGSTSGVKKESPSNTSSTPVAPPKPDDKSVGEVLQGLCALYRSYAHTVYVENMLRGRGASISGKLRFDIAPGSVVKIMSKGEVHLSGTDQLASTLFAHVERVTVNINSEARLAGTSFQFSHVRTERENGDERSSVAEHPLFGSNVYNGSGMDATTDPDSPKVDRAWEF